MKLSLWLAGGLLTTTCALMFVIVLDAEPFQDQSLAVLNAFLAYPIVAYSIFSVYKVGQRRLYDVLRYMSVCASCVGFFSLYLNCRAVEQYG